MTTRYVTPAGTGGGGSTVAARYPNSSSLNQWNANNQIIKYSCSCGKAFHLTEEYYCNGCSKLNCKFCITEEIDGYYCPNCLEHISIPEAYVSGMKCKKCFDCPICFNVLTYQSSGVGTGGTEQYFLSCGFCKWNTHGNDAFNSRLLTSLSNASPTTPPSGSMHLSGVSSPLSSNVQSVGKVLETLSKESSELNSLKDKKAISRMKMAQAMKQFLVQDQKHHKSNQRKNYIKVEDKWISNSVPRTLPNNQLIPNIVSNPVTHNNLLSVQSIKQTINTPITYQDSEDMQRARIDSRQFPEVMDNQALQEDEIPESIYSLRSTDELVSLPQQFKQLNVNSPGSTLQSGGSVMDLSPQHKSLLTRRSKRCKRCDRLLMKPDIKPDKSEFKRQHFAFSLVPRIQILRAIWTDTDLLELTLTLTNPLHSHIFILFPTISKTSFSSIDDNAQPIDCLTSETFVNGLLDEVDDNEKEIYIQNLKKNDNTRYIVERKENKLVMRLFVKVLPSGLSDTGEIRSSAGGDENVLSITESSIQPVTDFNNLKKYPSTFPNVKFTLVMEFTQKPNQLVASNTLNPTEMNQLSSTGTISTFSTPSTSTTPMSTTSISTDNLQKNYLKILFDIPSNKFENSTI